MSALGPDGMVEGVGGASEIRTGIPGPHCKAKTLDSYIVNLLLGKLVFRSDMISFIFSYAFIDLHVCSYIFTYAHRCLYILIYFHIFS